MTALENANARRHPVGNTVSATYGPPELCVWKVAPGTFWFQTTEPEYSRKLDQRQDARRVEVTGVNHYRRTYEMRGTWRKVKRIVNRYLMRTGMRTGDQFLGYLKAPGASKDGGSINIAACSKRGATGVLILKGGAN